MRPAQKKLTELRVRKAMPTETHAKLIDTEDTAENYFKTHKEVISIVESNTPQITSKPRTNGKFTQEFGQSVSVPSNTELDLVNCLSH